MPRINLLSALSKLFTPETPRRSEPRRFRPGFDCLENRELMAGGVMALPYFQPPPTLSPAAAFLSTAPMGYQIPLRQAQAAAVTSIGVNPDGTVTVNGPNESAATYRWLGGKWAIASWNHFVAAPNKATIWAEETWAANGDYACTFMQSGANGPNVLWATLTRQGNALVLTRHNVQGAPIYWGVQQAQSVSGTVTFQYRLNPNGTINNLYQYDATDIGTSWAAHWKNPKTNKDANYYANGWYEYYPGTWGPNTPLGPSAYGPFKSANFATLAMPKSPVATPPGVTVDVQSGGGYKYYTVWNSAHNQLVQFVYPATGTQTMQYQNYSHYVDGKWVIASSNSANPKNFITQTTTYEGIGRPAISQVTTRQVADGSTVTFHGSWQSTVTGVWLETAENYLDYASATIKYAGFNGSAVSRYGTLANNGLYAVDTINAAGTRIIQRQVFAKEGDPVLQTWTLNGANQLVIRRTNPDAHVTQDQFIYYVNNSNYYSNLTLGSYEASFDKQYDLIYDNGDSEMTSIYHWKYWVTKGRNGGLNDNYREWGGRGVQYNASDETSPEWLPDGNTPNSFNWLSNLSPEHRFWNQM